jgi:putative ABC transport system permease protein
MWKSYLKTALRNLQRRRAYAAINLLGLTIGITAFLAIAAYIHHEWSFDRQYADAERIYRVRQTFTAGGESQLVTVTPSALLPAMQTDLSEVETGVRLFNPGMFAPTVVKVGEETFQESAFGFADASFFEVFDLTMLAGTPREALAAPNQLVLTQSKAVAWFGSVEAALGKTVEVGAGVSYAITGVMQDFPANTHLYFEILASFSTLRDGKTPAWMPSNYFTYVKLQPGTEASDMGETLNGLIDKYMGEEMRQYGFSIEVELQPLTDVHFDTEAGMGMRANSDKKYLYIFGMVALLVIVIACINYVNLATAEATERNKEVGVRKVLGAARMQLVGQFMSETLVLSMLAAGLSVVVLWGVMPVFQQFTGVELHLLTQQPLLIAAAMLGLVAVVSIGAGAYPALVVSSFQPLQILKKNLKVGGDIWLRRVLVVFQFSVSIFLIIGTFIIYQQVSYMQSKRLGYDKENLVSLPVDGAIIRNVTQFKTEFQRRGIAAQAALASSKPMEIRAGYSIQDPTKPVESGFGITGFSVDHDIVNTLQLELLAGSNFDENDRARGMEEFPMMVNKTTTDMLGWTPEEAIGKKVVFGPVQAEIKAVLDDFHFASLHQKIGPLAMFIEPMESNVLLVKLAAGPVKDQIAGLESVWKELAPHRPFEYSFVDEDYGRLYRAEEKVGLIFTLFAGVAILIACMGLFGLISYIALRKTKEISIRKVLGASAMDVIGLLSREFMVLVAVSAVVAIGLGTWFGTKWVSGFAYYEGTPWWAYAAGVLLVMLISLVTISWRTVKVSLANPVDALKED